MGLTDFKEAISRFRQDSDIIPWIVEETEDEGEGDLMEGFRRGEKEGEMKGRRKEGVMKGRRNGTD